MSSLPHADSAFDEDVVLTSTVSATRPRLLAGLGRVGGVRTVGPVIIIPILAIIFQVLNSQFLTVQNLENVASDASAVLVLAVAQTFVILIGSIDLSISSVVTVAGVTAAILIPRDGLAAVPLVLLIGVGAGLVNGALFAYARLPSFLVTLGTNYAFGGVALFVTNGASIAVSPNLVGSGVLGGSVGSVPAIAIWAVAVLVVGVLVGRFTKLGRYAYIIGDAEPVADLSGVPVKRYKLYIFVLAGLLAAFGGLLLMYRDVGGDPTMGSNYLLPMIAAVVMGGTPMSGGMGGPGRTLLGVLIISIITNGMVLANVQPYLQTVIEGFVVVVAVALAMDRKRLLTVK